MCLILFALGQHPTYPLLLAANRDERFDRPTRPLGIWPEVPQVAAGRDLEAGGSWLGVSRSGRFAAVTNVREWPLQRGWPRSRGELVKQFLLGEQAAADYAVLASREHGGDYAGFNLLLGDASGLWYCANRRDVPPRRLAPGLYGLANGLLGDDWPKTRSGVAALRRSIETGPTPQGLLQLLANRTIPPDHELPDTGIGLEHERLLAPRFIAGADYGTRASTALLVRNDATAILWEQSYAAGGTPTTLERLEWQLDALPF